VALGGGGLYYHTKREAEQVRVAAEERVQEARVAAEAQAAQAAAAAAAVRTDMGMSPQEVVRRFGNATVLIEASWRLYDSRSGKEVFHRTQFHKGQRVPCYIEGPNQILLRWLTTEDQSQTNLPIRKASRGSGFVISENGFIMTNKHVAAGWMVGYAPPTVNSTVLVFKINGDMKFREVNLASQNDYKINTDNMVNWIPSEHGAWLFRPDSPTLIDGQARPFEGRGELSVLFPGNPTASRAQVDRVSAQADVAIIKINTQQPLATVQLATENIVKVGERVTVLGYPGFSTETVAYVRSHEIGQPSTKLQRVPEPTVTDGVISQISPPRQDRGDVTTIGNMGDVYQLTVPSGPGNSGGPAFNAAGKVIGVFTYGLHGRETTTFAVPIKYGRDLMQVQRTE
jgi:serine protease Do